MSDRRCARPSGDLPRGQTLTYDGILLPDTAPEGGIRKGTGPETGPAKRGRYHQGEQSVIATSRTTKEPSGVTL